jgi:hypothetical protein
MSSFAMSYQKKKLHPALKHGGFCASGLLPGEDRAAFERLHKELVAYFRPDGPLEHDAVAAIARRLWRKQNLNTLRTAELVRKRLESIRSEKVPSQRPPSADLSLLSNYNPNWIPPSAMEVEEGMKAAEFEATKEFGTDGYLLAEMGDRATSSQLLEELKIEERLDTMIAQQLKRLVLLKGLKSLSLNSSSLSSAAPLPRIQGPKEAA